jgi:large subunit ribosomal protein L23
MIVHRAVITEKGARLRESNNQFLFEVAMDANKVEIKSAVEEIFKVHVRDVTTQVRRGKPKRMGRHFGVRPNWKRAIVTLRDGETIEIFDQV